MKTAVQQKLAALLFVALATSSSAVSSNEAPTAPDNFQAIAVSSTEIRLMWDPATDDKRIRAYLLSRDGVEIATTRKTSYLDNSAQPDTTYTYTLIATDGQLSSVETGFTLSTPLTDPDDGVNDKPGKGKDRNNPDDEPPTDEPDSDPDGDPNNHNGAPSGWVMTFSDEFDGSGALDTTSENRNWRYEMMSDPLHRAGNTGMDEFGNQAESWRSPEGKRWSAWYNQHLDRTVYLQDGELIMGGYFSGEPDPTRPEDYLDGGVLTQYGNSKLYTSWIDTFSRKWVGPGDTHVVDPASPARSFKYGYFETRVNFSQMMTPGFRVSLWLMPASSDAEGQDLLVSNAYDTDGNNGVEIDIFEYEWINTEYENRINLALQGGAAGSLATNYDTTPLGISLHEGYHTIGLLWESDKLIWTLNGHVIKEIYDLDLIPDVYSYLIFSREMNSGVKSAELDNPGPDDVLEQLPYRPRDPGLYAKNVWEYRDRINEDKAIIDYIRIWQPQ